MLGSEPLLLVLLRSKPVLLVLVGFTISAFIQPLRQTRMLEDAKRQLILCRAASVMGALRQQHVRLENEHHLEGVLSTFGKNATYQDEAWGDSYPGCDGVRSYYEQLMAALPDLEIQVRQQHVTDDHVLLEVFICGNVHEIATRKHQFEIDSIRSIRKKSG